MQSSRGDADMENTHWLPISYMSRMLSCFSQVQLLVTLWTVAHQAPLSLGFSRQEYWSGLPCPPPGDLPDPGIKPTSLTSPAWQVDYLPLAAPEKPILYMYDICIRQSQTPALSPTTFPSGNPEFLFFFKSVSLFVL